MMKETKPEFGPFDFDPINAWKIVSDVRLDEKQFQAFREFDRKFIEKSMGEREAYQFIRGWLAAKEVDDYPVGLLLLNVISGAHWRVIDVIGWGDNRTWYVGTSSRWSGAPF